MHREAICDGMATAMVEASQLGGRTASQVRGSRRARVRPGDRDGRLARDRVRVRSRLLCERSDSAYDARWKRSVEIATPRLTWGHQQRNSNLAEILFAISY
jgi:hypothetical protein